MAPPPGGVFVEEEEVFRASEKNVRCRLPPLAEFLQLLADLTIQQRSPKVGNWNSLSGKEKKGIPFHGHNHDADDFVRRKPPCGTSRSSYASFELPFACVIQDHENSTFCP